jgi:hypothetical protein
LPDKVKGGAGGGCPDDERSEYLDVLAVFLPPWPAVAQGRELLLHGQHAGRAHRRHGLPAPGGDIAALYDNFLPAGASCRWFAVVNDIPYLIAGDGPVALGGALRTNARVTTDGIVSLHYQVDRQLPDR